MKKITIIFGMLGLLMSCTQTEQSPVVESSPTVIEVDSVALHIEAISEQLEKSEVLEHNIKKNITLTSNLKQQNDVLKKELKQVQDSVKYLKKELVEVKSKLPKKRNFIERILNKPQDSVEVVTVDTIETK